MARPKFSSSSTSPFIKGTWGNVPLVKAVIGCWGMIVPSSIGPSTYWLAALAVPASASTCAAVRLRRHLAVAEPVPEPQPAATEKATPVASADANVGNTKA